MCGMLGTAGVVQLHVSSYISQDFPVWVEIVILTDSILTCGFKSSFQRRLHTHLYLRLNPVSGPALWTQIDKWFAVWTSNITGHLETSEDSSLGSVPTCFSWRVTHLFAWIFKEVKVGQWKPARRLLQSSQKPFREKAPSKESVKAEGKPCLAAKGEFSLNDIPNRAVWEGSAPPHPAGPLPSDGWRGVSHMTRPGMAAAGQPSNTTQSQTGWCLPFTEQTSESLTEQ